MLLVVEGVNGKDRSQLIQSGMLAQVLMCLLLMIQPLSLCDVISFSGAARRFGHEATCADARGTIGRQGVECC
jgi:hypothetical protein